MKTKTLQTMFATALAWAVFALATYAQPLAPFQTQTNGAAYMSGEILIKLKPEATDAQLQDVVRRAGITASKHIQTKSMKDHGDKGITRAAINRDVDSTIQDLKNNPAVEYAQPNYIYFHQASANDPYYLNGTLWGMYGPGTTPANAYGTGAAAAWAGGMTGSQVVCVGIIDEGIQYNHPDLFANMWVNPGETAGDLVDNDGNGKVDDIYGWNALDNNGNIYNAAYDDHGTHVAGTIGAIGGNGKGVVGVNWNVSLISGKFLGPNGGTTIDAVEAIDYMTDLKTDKKINLVALNNSWGGGGYDSTLLGAIIRAAKADILFVVAAGNDSLNTDLTLAYPACYDTTADAGYNSVISVAAIDKTGALASFSNYGASTVDLGAPGVNIYSTLPGGLYGYASGTSMAAPHVTGAIALYASTHPGASAAQIREAVMNSTVAITSLTGKTVTGGRLSVDNLLIPPTQKPSAPSGFSAAVSGAKSIALKWTDNANNETSFKIGRWIVNPNADTLQTTIAVAANLKSYSDTGLIPGTTYKYSIVAWNAAGASASVESGDVALPDVASATVTSLPTDTATLGNWVGKYGAEGYDIVAYKKNITAYGTITPTGVLTYTWATSPTEPRYLQIPNQSTRLAACYYTNPNVPGSSFTVDVNLTDGKEHFVSLYCMDYDAGLPPYPPNRSQKIEVIDYNHGTVFDSQTKIIDSFVQGQYLVWSIKGHVFFRVTHISGGNAVVSGIFVNQMPIPTAPSGLTAASAISKQIDLAWVDNSNNEDGFVIQRSTKSSTGFTTIFTTGPNVKSYSNIGLASGTKYYYRVYAYNAGGNSASTSVVSATVK